MLVIYRSDREAIRIGDDIKIVVRVGADNIGRGNQVKILVGAPRHISVHRDEIYQKIQQEKSDGVKVYYKRSKKRLGDIIDNGNK